LGVCCTGAWKIGFGEAGKRWQEEMGMSAEEAPTDHRIRLLSGIEIAEGTMAFEFEKPAGFAFKPGQAADLTLPAPPETDSEGNARALSIVSSPFENHLMFATRIRDSAFKRSLKQIPLGAEVKITPAMGSFALHKNVAKPAVFLSGGIGITPFLSILRQADHDRLPQKLYLFYSNRRPEDRSVSRDAKVAGEEQPEFSSDMHHDPDARIQKKMDRRAWPHR
jgi:ferredoxin-NADP reductase